VAGRGPSGRRPVRGQGVKTNAFRNETRKFSGDESSLAELGGGRRGDGAAGNGQRGEDEGGGGRRRVRGRVGRSSRAASSGEGGFRKQGEAR